MKNTIIKITLLTGLLSNLLPVYSWAGEYETNTGTGTFSVSAPAKTIFAESEKIHIHIDNQAGILQLKVPVNSFQFTNNFVSDSMNAVIHERFNHYYMESERYPYITYSASMTNNNSVNLEKDGSYPVHTTGTLHIHGVDREVTTQGMINVKGGNITIESKIVVLPHDYNIRIPDYIGNMYFKEVRIECTATLKKIR